MLEELWNIKLNNYYITLCSQVCITFSARNIICIKSYGFSSIVLATLEVVEHISMQLISYYCSARNFSIHTDYLSYNWSGMKFPELWYTMLSKNYGTQRCPMIMLSFWLNILSAQRKVYGQDVPLPFFLFFLSLFPLRVYHPKWLI